MKNMFAGLVLIAALALAIYGGLKGKVPAATPASGGIDNATTMAIIAHP